MKIRDVMSADVITVGPETSLHEVARLLSERRISGLPVVDAAGRVLGVVSEADVLVKELGHPEPRHPLEWLLGDRHDADELRRRAARTAREAMTSPAIAVEPDRPLRVAADLMVKHRINRLPVIDDGRMVGIVTRADLVRAYLHLDEETARTIRDEILAHTMWLDPSAFEVDVREGMVTIAGTVDRRSTARIIVKLIGLVDGVAGVESHLAWRLDDQDLRAAPGEHEPGAASITAREQPPAMHR